MTLGGLAIAGTHQRPLTPWPAIQVISLRSPELRAAAPHVAVDGPPSRCQHSGCPYLIHGRYCPIHRQETTR